MKSLIFIVKHFIEKVKKTAWIFENVDNMESMNTPLLDR